MAGHGENESRFRTARCRTCTDLEGIQRHGGDAQFLRTEDEANMTHQKSRTHERKTKQQRLQPGQDTMS